MKANVAVIQAVRSQVDIIEDRLLHEVSLRPEFSSLNTMQGIGEVLETVIMLETGSIERLPALEIFLLMLDASKVSITPTARKRRVKAMPRTATPT
ncbi:hypothetical protein [Pseudomonas vanderleydeniana]|uniref:hypothetical protein n=1 Tax=Pseudomonas vanderleydeniana TaxID=2745495 RepID=UPI0021F2A3B3|nr:hypothetical protein [Pseudomonas vanderleydeniana]